LVIRTNKPRLTLNTLYELSANSATARMNREKNMFIEMINNHQKHYQQSLDKILISDSIMTDTMNVIEGTMETHCKSGLPINDYVYELRIGNSIPLIVKVDEAYVFNLKLNTTFNQRCKDKFGPEFMQIDMSEFTTSFFSYACSMIVDVWNANHPELEVYTLTVDDITKLKIKI